MMHLFGDAVPVNAEVIEMGQFSAHAGKSELLRWMGGLQKAPKKMWLTHGEPAAAQALQAAAKAKFSWTWRWRGISIRSNWHEWSAKIILGAEGNLFKARLVYIDKTTRG